MHNRNRAIDARKTTKSQSDGLLFDPRLLPQAMSLLATAQTDRRAAEVLYKERLFPQAVFLLQQAVEKAVKAIGLATRAISPSELHSAISHKSINVFVKGLWKIIAAVHTRSRDDSAFEQFERALKALETDRDRFANVDRPTSADLTSWTQQYRSLRDSLRTFLSGPKATDMFVAIRAEMDTQPAVPFGPAELTKRILDALIALMGFYFLGLATLAHAIASRYGDRTRTPIELYTESTPLIAHFTDLVSIASECIDIAESSFAFYMSLP